jgi:hypothetical protein
MVNRSIEAAASSMVPPDIKNTRFLVLVSVVSSDVADFLTMLSPGPSEKLTAPALPEKKAISTKMKNIAEKMDLTCFILLFLRNWVEFGGDIIPTAIRCQTIYPGV